MFKRNLENAIQKSEEIKKNPDPYQTAGVATKLG